MSSSSKPGQDVEPEALVSFVIVLQRNGRDLAADEILEKVRRARGYIRILAENLIPRVARDYGLALEVWGFDRRTNQLEDRAGAQQIHILLESAGIGLENSQHPTVRLG